MPHRSLASFQQIAREFRLTMQELQELYVSAGQQYAQQHPESVPGGSDKFLQMMLDLHRGLLVKVYLEIVEADRTWQPEERTLAAILLKHVWGEDVPDNRLRETIGELRSRAEALSWYSLIRPFDQLAPLRDRISELETLVMRLGQLIAKADGQLCPAEALRLKNLQQELARHLRPIPLDEPGQHEAARVAQQQAIRQLRSDSTAVRQQCRLEETADATLEEKTRQQRLAEALAELDGLIGLDAIKRDIRELTNFLRVQEKRARAGLPRTTVSLHMVFSGNPGTGKTTVARIIGQVYGAMGVLQKGHLVETDRAGLVAGYAGQTAIKANKKIDEALDGILFIDEAYSLVAERGDDPFGHEAVQTLLKRMEDDRQRLIVILAGYPRPITRLLHSNPGLASRFDRRFEFEDYTVVELCRIFEAMCQKNHYVLPSIARAKLLLGFEYLLRHRDERFGNGRLVRNVFETSIRRLANRVADVPELSHELLTRLEAVDLVFPDVPDEIWADLDAPRRQFHVECPGCRRGSRLPQAHLGRRVRCNRCQQRFLADWGEPVPAEP